MTIDENDNTHVDELKTNASIDDSTNAKLHKVKPAQERNNGSISVNITKRKRKHTCFDDCTKATKVKNTKFNSWTSGNKNDIPCRKIVCVQQKENRSPNVQGSNVKDKKKHKIEKGHNMQILAKQSLYNPDQVVHNEVAYSALSKHVLDLVPENLVSVNIPMRRPLETETSSSAHEIQAELPVLNDQARQEHFMHAISCSKHDLDCFKAEHAVDDSSYNTNHNNKDDISSLSDSPRLPTYDEALTFPTLEEYLKDNPMTDAIRKVLDFQPPISLERTFNSVSDRSQPSSLDFPEHNVHKPTANSRDVFKGDLQLQTKFNQRGSCVDPPKFLSNDKGSNISANSSGFEICETVTPPYTYLLPKQPKPPDKFTL